jgi:uncharacterized protein
VVPGVVSRHICWLFRPERDANPWRGRQISLIAVEIDPGPVMQKAHVAALYRYPVKGFSGESLARVSLEAGATFPRDRAFAIENGPSGFRPEAPRYFPKNRFLMLMRNETVAEYQTRFDDESETFTVTRDGRVLIAARLGDPAGRAALEAWAAEAFRDVLRGPPRVLSAEGHSFSDVAAKVVHLINLESVRALESAIGRPVDPRRFRANILIDGLPAFAELEWASGALAIGEASFRGTKRTGRCAATNVDPATARRDMDIPATLIGLCGHKDFGIYLSVNAGGEIAVGDTVTRHEPEQAAMKL